MAKSKLVKANEKIAEHVVAGYKKSKMEWSAASERSQTHLWMSSSRRMESPWRKRRNVWRGSNRREGRLRKKLRQKKHLQRNKINKKERNGKMKKSNFVAMILGTIGGILFALGMCMTLIPEWNASRPGVVMGVIGAVVLLVMVLVWRKMEKKRRLKYRARPSGLFSLEL